METNNKSFWELINSFKINIPIIQRDYAQGREEESEKREKFLTSLYTHIILSQTLDLDFIYGRTKDQIFYPIDGQQRLTTLFLLHWYISIKEKVENEIRQVLTKFVYDTRISSREFCKSIVDEIITIPNDGNGNDFIKEIQNKHWFRNSWANDPTIKAMLIMIQAIHDKFKETPDISIWDRLTTQRLITFQDLDLGKKGFELTDELYIKMNSRGKQLTPFENFKANFIQFIDRNFKDKTLEHPFKGKISYSGYFSYRIEKEWTDLFWAYRGDKETIDIEFTNYFEFVAQLCFFRLNKDAKAEDFKNSFNQYEDIFKHESNLLFLFDSLDKVYLLSTNKGFNYKENIDNLFETLFTNVSTQNSNSGKVTLFWNSFGQFNLFERIIKSGNSEDGRNKIVFYSFLYYLITHDLSEINDGLKKYVRVLRNLIQSSRQRNDTKYNTNFRVNYFGNYWILFEQLCTLDVYFTLQNQTINNKGTRISDLSLNNEKEKAEIMLNNISISNELFGLEEFSNFGGLIHQLEPKTNHSRFNNYLNAVYEIWNDEIFDTLIIQSLIACGFNGVTIKETKWMGNLTYFGKNGNWETVLTSEETDISKGIILLLDSYCKQKEKSPTLKLEAIIKEWFKLNGADRTWKYYFLKYSDFTSRNNYYAWKNDFEIRMLGSEGSNPLLSYHINPYVLTVCRTVNDPNICIENDCFHQYSVNSPLVLKNGLTLTSTYNSWVINDSLNILKPNIISKYNLKIDGNNYFLEETSKFDRIEIAVEFAKNI